MDEFLVLCIALAILGTLIAGGIAFILVLVLRRRVKRLEGKLAILERRGAPAEEPQVAPIPVPAPAPESAPPVPAHAAAPPPVETPAGAEPLPAAPPCAAAPPAEPARASSWAEFESRLGTRWLSWIGALISLVAIALLLKFLYDQGLIGPAGRVAIGLAASLGILCLGELGLRRASGLLSQAVSAAGGGGLFLTTFLSFKFYGFGGRLATFALLVYFAAFLLALAVTRRGAVLAALGLVCAYATPYLLSTGQDEAEALFAYLAIFGLASAALRVACPWRWPSLLCAAFTAVYYAGWYAKFYAPERLGIALAGALGFPALFALSALASGAWRRREIWLGDLVLAAIAVVAAVGQSWVLLVTAHRMPLGFTLIGCAAFALGMLWVVRARGMRTAAAEETMLLVSAAPLALLVPALLKAEGAVIGWSLAAAVLAAIGGGARRLAMFALAGACLWAAWRAGMSARVAHSGYFIVIANPVFLAWFTAAAACFFTGARFSAAARPRRGLCLLGAGVQVLASAAFLCLLTYEAIAWFSGLRTLPGADAAALRDYQTATLAALWALYPWIYLWRAAARPKLWQWAAVHYAALGLFFLLLLLRLHARAALPLLNICFAAGALFPAMAFVTARRFAPGNRQATRAFEIYGHVLVLALLTAEFGGCLMFREWAPVHHRWIRLALVSVVWAGYAAGLVWRGIARSTAAWRWLGLILLGATAIKVLTVDLAEVRQLWRVLSFAVLGVLLLACSYAYIRYEARRRSQCERK